MTQGQLPDGLVPSGTVLEFTDADMPDALRREHALGPGNWGALQVLEGGLTFVDLVTNEETELSAGGAMTIHPQAPHRVATSGPVRFSITFYVEAAK